MMHIPFLLTLAWEMFIWGCYCFDCGSRGKILYAEYKALLPYCIHFYRKKRYLGFLGLKNDILRKKIALEGQSHFFA